MSASGKYVPPHLRRKQETSMKPSGSRVGTRYTESEDFFTSGDAEDIESLCDAFTLVYCINLRRRADRWETFSRRMQSSLGKRCQRFIDKVERFDAIDGATLLETSENQDVDDKDFPQMDWDATKNALYDRKIQPPMNKRMTPGEVGCAMSHTKLWRLLEESRDARDTMLILEDDAIFFNKETREFSKRAGERTRTFVEAFTSLWSILPSDWDILYLGFSSRGDRMRVVTSPAGFRNGPIEVTLFRPTYGFHTHAYALTKAAASKLLSNGPPSGPVDVWLADNEWFGLKVVCAVVANEGYNREGASLISQRRHDTNSDIGMSGRTAYGGAKTPTRTQANNRHF
jgi:GR25 family glycosyltransferase involved in LPS biosynthesis